MIKGSLLSEWTEHERNRQADWYWEKHYKTPRYKDYDEAARLERHAARMYGRRDLLQEQRKMLQDRLNRLDDLILTADVAGMEAERKLRNLEIEED